MNSCRSTGRGILRTSRTRSQHGKTFSGGCKAQGCKYLLLTKRFEVRILFGEPNISHFEILSGLLVNDAEPFIGKNVPYCWGMASLRFGPIVRCLAQTG